MYRLHKTKNRLLSLRRFFLKQNHYNEAYALGKIILASSEDAAKNKVEHLPADETVAMRPRPWRSRSEPYLIEAGIEPIRYIAGIESEKRQEGTPSKEGNVYEVLYKGRLAVAKVLIGFSLPEPETWKRIESIKERLPEDQAKHLPEIYDIIEPNNHTSIIVMELLNSPSSHIKKVLRSKELRGEDTVLQNEEFLSEALSSAFSVIQDFSLSTDERVNSESFALLETEADLIRQDIEGELIKKDIKPSDVSKRIQEAASGYIKMFSIDDKDLIRDIGDSVQDKLMRYLNTAPRPVAKYYSARDIDNTVEVLRGGPSSSNTSRNENTDKRLDALHKERAESVYSETPESFLYSERYMPETKGLFSLLNSLKDFGIEWSDVHANNIMESPATRELVLIDVGFFS